MERSKHLSSFLCLAGCAIVVLVVVSTGFADPVYNPANGHYYELVDFGIQTSWFDAKAAAEASSYLGNAGYLATITSEQENQFLVDTLGGAAITNHWLGGYQDTEDPAYVEPDGGWKWITGEAWTYDHWLEGQPDNGWREEDHLMMVWETTEGLWNDYGFDGQHLPYPATVGSIVEYVPEPASMLVLAGGALLTLRRKRR